MPPQDLLNYPTTPRALSACKLAEPRTVQDGTPAVASALASRGWSLGRMRPPQDLLNHPTTPRALSACKLAKPRTIQASPLRLQSNSRALRQVVSRFIRSSVATILPSDFEE